MRILLADDHALFTEGLQNLLRAGGHVVLDTARDGLEAAAMARAVHPDLILMDVSMPRLDGLSATRLIKAEMPEIKIVILSTSDSPADMRRALEAGATGYLLKDLQPRELFGLLDGLERGEPTLARRLSEQVLGERRPPPKTSDTPPPKPTRGRRRVIY